MTEAPLRVAIAGAGMIARVHADAARRAGALVVGVSASTPERGKAAAQRLGVPRSFDSSADLAVSDEVDVVHVCTPNALHGELVRLALSAGKHVICEKPLSTTAHDAQSLSESAQGTGLVAAVPFVYRYHPMAAEARARVLSGSTGPVRLIHGHYLQDWLSSPGDNNWRVDPAAGGESRAFADIGSHWCDLVEWVTGHRISELTASVQTVLPERDGAAAGTFSGGSGVQGPADSAASAAPVAVTTEDAVQVLFRTDRGASGNLVVSQVSPGRKNRLWFEVDGSEASLSFDQENPESLLIGTRAGSIVLPRDPALLSAPAARISPLPAGHPMGYHDCFAGFVADVYQAIADGSDPGFPTFSDAARTARLTEAVLRSARTRSWIEVS
jgi:predicted dehydrogenase